MTTLYHDILALVASGSAEQVEAARCELEDRASVLRDGAPPETSPVAETSDAGTRESVAAVFMASIMAVGLTTSCVEGRRAVHQLIESLEVRA